MSLKAFKLLEQSLGYGLVPNGVLACRELRGAFGISSFQFDWVHNILVQGIFPIELNLFIELWSGAMVKRLSDFVKAHTWPKWLASKVSQIKIQKGTEVKGSASEFLGVYSIIRSFVEEEKIHLDQSARVSSAAISFLALCELLDLLALSIRASISSERLRCLITQHLRLFKEAHGIQYMVPKHHYNLHIPAQMDRHQVLLNTFVMERRHKIVKKYGNEMSNHGAWFERSLLTEVTLAHYQFLTAPDKGDDDVFFCAHGLVSPLRAAPGPLRESLLCALGLASSHDLGIFHDGLVVSQKLRMCSGRLCAVGDIVVSSSFVVCKALAFAAVQEVAYALVEVGHQRDGTWQFDDDCKWIAASEVQGCYIYRARGRGVQVVPPAL